MIQRKQTLFLLQLVFFGIALLFIPCNTIVTAKGAVDVQLIPLRDSLVSSSMGHLAAVTINFIGLILSFSAIFLYRRRELQVKLSYVLLAIWLILSLMIAFCPFVNKTPDVRDVEVNYFTLIIGAFAILAAFLAARFIKKDIELLKSADRIR